MNDVHPVDGGYPVQIQIKKKIGEAKKFQGAVKQWRNAPADLTAACVAARHYADRTGDRMVVIGGNSYGAAVFHIAKDSDSVFKFGIVGKTTVAVVMPGGDVFQAIAS